MNRRQASLQLHPRAPVRLQSAVEGDGGVDVRRAVPGHVEDRRAEGARRAEHGLPVGGDLPGEGEVGALHVGGHEEAEVARVDLAREVLLVDGGEREGVQRGGRGRGAAAFGGGAAEVIPANKCVYDGDCSKFVRVAVTITEPPTMILWPVMFIANNNVN